MQFVFVIEPSGVIRQKLAKIIRGCGYEPLFSLDGSDISSKFQENKDEILLVMMEWYLPSMQGVEVLVQLKESVCQNIPVVFVTTESKKENVVMALKNGASDYIIKPFSEKQIKQKIQRFVQK